MDWRATYACVVVIEMGELLALNVVHRRSMRARASSRSMGMRWYQLPKSGLLLIGYEEDSNVTRTLGFMPLEHVSACR